MALKALFQGSKPRKASAAKYIYYFDEGSAKDQGLLGYKGASLCELKRLGMTIPPGFILTTELCKLFYRADDPKLPFNLNDEVTEAVHELERQTGRTFDVAHAVQAHSSGGEGQGNFTPLLLSVRCASSVDIPGLTSTVLNIGINTEVAKVLSRETRNLRWAYDTYRKFLQTFGIHTLGVEEKLYDDILADARLRRGVASNSMLNASDLMYVVERFKSLVDIPEDPWQQLSMVVNAMLKSWISKKAEKFRDLHSIPFEMGNAIVVQSMVFGNFNLRSGVGSVTTRHPVTGDKVLHGWCTRIAEGDAPEQDSDLRKSMDDLSNEQPNVYRELQRVARRLETHFRDVQEIEFTVEDGRLFILETRKAQRSITAALRFATSLANERVLSEREALLSIDARLMKQFVYPLVDPQYELSPEGAKDFIVRAQRGNGGVATGTLIFDSEDVLKLAPTQNVILCKNNLSWADEEAVKVAHGIIILKEQPCSLEIDLARLHDKTIITGLHGTGLKVLLSSESVPEDETKYIQEGDTISIDGHSGSLYRGVVPTIDPLHNRDFQNIMHWTEKYKGALVKCFATSYEEVERAVGLGAEGVGLFSLDAMVLSKECIGHFQKMVLCEDAQERSFAGRDLEELIRKNIFNLYGLMQSKKVVLRLLIGPLSKFFPSPSDRIFEQRVGEIASSAGVDEHRVRSLCTQLHESNPVMGCKGGRLEIVRQDLARLQARAITGAALNAINDGIPVTPYVAIPWISGNEEMEYICRVIQRASEDYALTVNIRTPTQMKMGLGALIEVPRACLQAEKIIKNPYTDFMLFNSDSLTEMVFGMSRQDQHRFMDIYHEKDILGRSPFHTLDKDSVGKLIRAAVEKCKEVKPNVKLGVFGDHCGDRASVEFFTRLGIDIMICSHLAHIPTAKLVAAQSHITSTPGMKRYVDEELFSIDPHRGFDE